MTQYLHINFGGSVLGIMSGVHFYILRSLNKTKSAFYLNLF
jgi:Na+-driven multidrug efflux pump